MSKIGYGKPSMNDLPYELGKSILEEMLNAPKPDWQAMKKKADEMEARMYASRIEEEKRKNTK